MDDGGSIVSDVAEAAAHVVGSLLGEIKKIGQTATSQMTGSQSQTPTADDVAKLQKNEQEFKKDAIPEVQARIQAIYAEYAAKKKKEQMMAEQQTEAVEEQKQELNEAKKQQIDQSNPAIAKNRAEIKNYGAE